jgi:hypothetical protein
MDLAKLYFRSGTIFEDDIRRRLASPVCPGRPNLPSTFWLVISFGCCTFKLDTVSVGYLFQASLGGFAKGFNVSQLSDRVFRFSIFSKAVGFHVYNSKCIDRSEFRAFFNLWNQGGPNWIHEYRKFIQEENANWWIIRGKKKISFANIVKLPPLSGANAVPIHSRKVLTHPVGNFDETRFSVFKRLGSSARSSRFCGSRNFINAKNSAIPMNVPPRQTFSVVSYSSLNGGVISRGRRRCAVHQDSNLNLPRPRNLQWRSILRNGPFASGPRPLALDISVSSGSFGVGPLDFRCHFCKVKGHLELFCNLKKTNFGFPLSSFPSFERRSNLEGTLKFVDYSSWFRPLPGSLTAGPPKFGCFEEFARAVLLKKSEQTRIASLELSLGVTSPKPQTAPLPLVC